MQLQNLAELTAGSTLFLRVKTIKYVKKTKIDNKEKKMQIRHLSDFDTL